MPFAGRPKMALANAVVPAWRSCTHICVVWNATRRPSSLIDGPEPPAEAALAKMVVGLRRSRTNTSAPLPLPSPVTRSLAKEENATKLGRRR